MLRVATPPNKMTAVMVIAEDEQGSGVMLMVYQHEDTEYGLAEDIAQVGGVCIVKEPYFKTMSNGDYGVRVDHVTDIVWLAEDDEMVPLRWGPRNTGVEKTAMELKVIGNAALKARDLNKAVKCYTKALKCAATTEENQTLKLNRSLAYLKLRRYDEAFMDATGISEVHEVSEKGAYRAARSLYELQMFEKCRKTLMYLLDTYKNNTEAKEQLLRTEERLSEQTGGKYDFKAMYKAAERTPPCLDNATYIGPVAIKISHHHTTGIFIQASHINHSCHCNARRSFIGDMIIVRAARDIPAATEISFWYAPPEPGRTWAKTQENLRHWGFQCSCTWCQQDKKTAKKTHTKRAALLEDLKAAFLASGSTNLPKAEKLLAAIEKTYSAPANDTPRLELADPYLLLTRIHNSHHRPQPAIQTAFKALTSLGFLIAHHSPDDPPVTSFEILQWGLPHEQAIETWTHVWTACDKVAPHLCDKAQEYAKISYRVCMGEDDTFDETVGKMARERMRQGGDLGTAFMEMTLG